MKKNVICVFLLVLAGCAAPSQVMVRSDGAVVRCAHLGGGVIGVTAALIAQSGCVDDYRKLGYVPIEERNANRPSSEAGAVGAKPSPDAAKLVLPLPEGWERKPLTEAMASSGGSVYATNRTTDAGVIVSTAKREGISDLMAYATSRRANQISRLSETKATEISRMEIGGRGALRFTVTGKLKTGLSITYLITLLEGKEQLVTVTTWSAEANFQAQKTALEEFASQVSGIS